MAKACQHKPKKSKSRREAIQMTAYSDCGPLLGGGVGCRSLKSTQPRLYRAVLARAYLRGLWY